MSIEFRSPVECPFGHRLGPGLVRLGWQPCQCPAATDGQRGHTTLVCAACERSGWTTTAYQPEHLRGGPGPDTRPHWLTVHLDRLARGETP